MGLEILTVGVDKSWRHVRIDHLCEDVRTLLCLSLLTCEGFIHWGEGRHFLTMKVETEIITYNLAPLPSPPPPKYSYIYDDSECHYYYLSTGRYLTLVDRLWKLYVESLGDETGEGRMEKAGT